IPFVGWLERSGQQRFLLDRLRREFRINARRSKKDQPLDIGQMRGLDDIRLNREIIEQEIGRIRVVGKDSANLGGGEDDNIWLGPGHPLPAGLLLAQIEIYASHGEDYHVFL